MDCYDFMMQHAAKRLNLAAGNEKPERTFHHRELISETADDIYYGSAYPGNRGNVTKRILRKDEE